MRTPTAFRATATHGTRDDDAVRHASGLLVTSAVDVAVPAAVAVGVVLDWAQDVRWRAAVRRMTLRPAGPAVAGQQIVEELRFAGLTFTTPTRIEEADARHAVYAGSGGAVSVRGSRSVDPTGPATCRIVTSLRLQGHGPMRPLARVLLGSYRRNDAADLRRLAALLEADHAASANP